MKNKKYLTVGFLFAGLVFLGASYYVHTQEALYTSKMKELIAQQETTLTSIAEVTDRNGADAVVASIIKDCDLEDRKRFDELLSSLDRLTHAQLRELDTLFSACGNFYAQRKAIMVARLKREYEVYKDYVSLLSVVDSRTEDIIYPTEKWETLVSLEAQRSDLSSELVTIQKEIIQALLDNVSVQDPAMKEKITRAQEVRDNLSLTGIKIDTLREEIIGL